MREKKSIPACFIGLSIAMSSFGALAGPTCTTEPKSNWISEDDFKKKVVEKGYTIKVFKITKENCYEIYGINKYNNKVEVYFDPTTASIIKEIKI